MRFWVEDEFYLQISYTVQTFFFLNIFLFRLNMIWNHLQMFDNGSRSGMLSEQADAYCKRREHWIQKGKRFCGV